MFAPRAEPTEAALSVSNSAVLRALVRTGLVVGTTVVAQAVPFFADVVGLTGALFGCTTTMLLPCLCYLRVRSKTGGVVKTGLETAACLAILAVGAAIVGFGTYSSVKQMHQRL
ncbi:amino acid transporter AVT1J-like [Triticum urartu]|uniref:amino acid transporter AVT1J-like n=1 Tax=Triticum urartu TaxID=4572 RepID=UPI00204358F7|nr:amino acid transporter AVT1J-like [Triticum urartu]